MSRISQSFRARLANRIAALHISRINRRKAESLIVAASVDYLPLKLRAVVRAGLGEHLRRDDRVAIGGATAYVYSGAAVGLLAADPNLNRQVHRLAPTSPRTDTWTLRRPILQKLQGLSTFKQLLTAHPELTELVAFLRDSGPEPDQDALRRKLVRAGWPLTAVRK